MHLLLNFGEHERILESEVDLDEDDYLLGFHPLDKLLSDQLFYLLRLFLHLYAFLNAPYQLVSELLYY